MVSSQIVFYLGVSYGRGSWVVGTKSWVVGRGSWVPSRGSLLKIINDY